MNRAEHPEAGPLEPPSSGETESIETEQLVSERPLPPAPASARRGPGRIASGLIGAAIMAGGIGLGWVIGGGGDLAAPVVGDVSTTAATVIESVSPRPTLPAGEEPVAAVAQALLPSMVQIENGFGLGSGFVYEEDHVLTAAHVVEGSTQVQVRFADGSQANGIVLGTDPVHDIAVIDVETNDAPPAPLALDEELTVGQLAVALGSPWGLEQTVTSGVVSAVDRPVADRTTAQVLIQTDASINPGNSGGALADRQGRVIGVNIQIFTVTGSNSGVGFAVPIAVAHDIADQIVAGTPIETAYLGVRGEDATGDRAGAVITEVTDDGPAAASGLEVGDIVTAVDAQAVRSMIDLAARIRSYNPGRDIVLDVIRDGESLTLTVTLGVRPAGD
ncbi:MAG: S1C family serine protease [Acidimicrobiia bacterium]